MSLLLQKLLDGWQHLHSICTILLRMMRNLFHLSKIALFAQVSQLLRLVQANISNFVAPPLQNNVANNKKRILASGFSREV
jgi:hypothetical protein